MSKIKLSQFSEWLGYVPQDVYAAIELVKMSDPDGAYTHAQDMNQDTLAEIIELIYFEYGSVQKAIEAFKEDESFFMGEEYIDEDHQEKGESGLIVYPLTLEDDEKLRKFSLNDDFYCEYDSEGGYWFFPELEENYDSLEFELDEKFNELGINVRYEGVFSNMDENKGLWHNIHKKRKEGRKPAKPGDDAYPDKKQWDKLTKEEEYIQEGDNTENYMFWQNLQTICNYVNEMLDMDKSEVDTVLNNNHDWAADHISTAKDDVQEVYEFLKNRNKTEITENSNIIYEDEYGSIEKINLSEAKYKGKKVTLNKPFYTPDGHKKKSVYVKNDKGNVVKVNFGDPNMKIKKSNPKRRKSFRARHKCNNLGPRWKPKYWSCKEW